MNPALEAMYNDRALRIRAMEFATKMPFGSSVETLRFAKEIYTWFLEEPSSDSTPHNEQGTNK